MRKGEFRLLGNLISIALLYDCAGPRCFTPSVTARLLNGPEIRPTIQEVPDIEVQEKLAALVTAKDDEEFQSKMETFEERFSFGVTRFKVPYAEREDLSRNIAQHFCISVCNEEIQEVRKGMEVLGVLKVLEDHYDESKNEFILPAIQKASSILAMFTNIEYTQVKEGDLLDKGKRDLEEDIFYHFTNCIESLEYQGAMELPLIILEEDGSEKEVTTVITLQEVTRFLTGSKYVTASLEGKGTICFDHFKRSGTVIANTCNIVLTFPVLE